MIVLALLLASAQHEAHAMPAAPAPAPAQSPKRQVATPAPPTAGGCSPEHAAMGHCQPAAAVGPSGTDQPAGNAPPPPAPRVDHADRSFGAAAMRASRGRLYREHGGGRWSQVMLDLAEIDLRDGRDGYRWDGEAWFGGDRDRLVVKTEGAGAFGRRVADAELQALYSRAIGPYFNLQAGARYDLAPRSRGYAALGVEGLAPYWFEVEATLFLSDRGRVSARAEAYYDQRITQRLILQPRAEVEASRGGVEAEFGVRLRYEIAREFAPYLGAVVDDGGAGLVLGIRGWF